MTLNLALLLVSFYAISKASDFFIDAASGLGQRHKLPDYLIGSLIVGIGTSLPEFVTSLSALVEDQPQLVAPNVYGTVTANIFAGLGFAAVGLLFLVRVGPRLYLFTPSHAMSGGSLNFKGANPLENSLGIILLATFLSYYFCRDGTFSRFEAGLFFFGYVLYLQTDIRRARLHQPPDLEADDDDSPLLDRDSTGGRLSFLLGSSAARKYFRPHALITGGLVLLWLTERLTVQALGLSFYALLASFVVIVLLDASLSRHWNAARMPADIERLRSHQMQAASSLFSGLYLVASLGALFLSGDLIVQSTIFLADWFGLSSVILAGSIIALGTSLPDILVAVKVARRGRHQMLIGHIMQSNIFDVLLIMGVCGLIVPLPVAGTEALLAVEFALGANLILLAILHDNRVSAAEGAFLALAYAAFLGLLYGLI